MANRPVFTAELDVSRCSSYGSFISGLRDQLVRHAGATRHLELVLLPVQQQDPRHAPWFHLLLRCSGGDSVVLLQIRADNLYIRGYRSQLQQDYPWWEFKRGGGAAAVIDGSTQLSFDDSYGKMGKTAGVKLEDITLGKEELEAAVRHLAAAENDNAHSQKGTARSLMTISVMICEATRFRSIAGVLGHMMTSSIQLPPHMLKQVNNWGSLSIGWLGAALYAQPFELSLEASGVGSSMQRHGGIIPQNLLAPVKIECQDHAMMALGVLLNLQWKLQGKHGDALAAHWRAVLALARRLDRERD